MRDLETTLIELNRYGSPKVVRMDRGWWARCNLFVQAKGAEVNVDSETTHATPSAAASECLERVEAVVHGISQLADQKALPRA
ncbi:hypothetical protein PY254_10480 [Rhodanobacter sp. AS-Z3]|uniref:hypothetical protein n=1 Tax=Rhodanobacter sp. AS-Z3 TaxID=3031330 RepID=UPI002478FDE2|nr:hypothetical protein [Rhodanobacter sp. AS-Z3]WEN13672.1 hypothetical protein PY254_10480 [Rhodanobacter sp. AS-Z3]